VGYAIVEVAAMAGDPGHPAAAGPAVIASALQDAGCVLASHRVSVGSPGGGMISDSIRVSTQVREVVSMVPVQSGVDQMGCKHLQICCELSSRAD
jgi:hypothetical protein